MKKNWLMMAIGLLSIFLFTGCEQQDYATAQKDMAETFPLVAEKQENNPQFAVSKGPYGIFHTTAGDITVVFYKEKAPKAVKNFIDLAQSGAYKGSLFHYVGKEVLVQGGLPKKGEEKSSTGEAIEDEISDDLHHFHGALAMANTGANTNLSQFYFVASSKIPESEKLVAANMHMNTLIRSGEETLAQRGEMSTEELTAFETELNQKIQSINTEGIPKDAMERYEPSVNTYMKEGGAYHLDYKHTVFGQVIQGLNIVDSMSQVFTEPETGEPKKPLKIKSIEIVESLEKK